MKKFGLIFLIALTACNQRAEEFPIYEFRPLANPYVQNGITGYLKLWEFEGELEKQDSVRINAHGLETDRISVSGHWFSETKFKFGSLDRMVQIYHHSDIRYTYRISYVFNADDRILEQHWQDVGPSDTIELWSHKYFL